MIRRSPRLLALEDRLTPAIATWDGGGANNLWSTPQNWVGDVAPIRATTWCFPRVRIAANNVNDFPAGRTFIRSRSTDRVFNFRAMRSR